MSHVPVWSRQEEADLRRLWNDRRVTVLDMCERFQRTENSVRARALKLRLGKRVCERVCTDDRCLRPRHVTAEHGSEAWWSQNDAAYVSRMRAVYPGSEVSIRRRAEQDIC